MASTKHICKNHPENFTSKRCYYCKDFICIDCQKHYFHHIFCSIKCVLYWKSRDLFGVFNISREFIWYAALLVLSNIIVYNLITTQIDNLKNEGVSFNKLDDSVKVYPAPHDFIIDSLRYVVKGTFKLQLSSQKNTVLSLVHNGLFIETLLNGEEGFSFKDVQLAKGGNTFEIYSLSADGKSTLVETFKLNYKAPRLDYLMQPVYRVKTKEKKVALTFDGGSSNKGTTKVLSILKEQSISCTMFITGQFIENFPNLVQQMIDDGHEVGNHSYNHPHFTNIEIDGSHATREKVTKSYFTEQLNITDSLYYEKFGKHLMPYWRAPFGEINSEILYWAAEQGYRHIGWSHRCDSWDWVADKSSPLYRSSRAIEDHFLAMEEKGGLMGKIILMHLGTERQDDFPYLSLASLIKKLRQRDYQFVKVSDLLKN